MSPAVEWTLTQNDHYLYRKGDLSQVLVAHTCNPSYSGGREQEDLSSPGQIVREIVSGKTLHKNRAGGVAQSEGSEFKPQNHKRGGGIWTQMQEGTVCRWE
jgi:hypothetical protein